MIIFPILFKSLVIIQEIMNVALKNSVNKTFEIEDGFVYLNFLN